MSSARKSAHHPSGDDRAVLEDLIATLKQRAEVDRRENRLVSAAELAHIVRYLRLLLPAGAAP
jgi:hypothetical protein